MSDSAQGSAQNSPQAATHQVLDDDPAGTDVRLVQPDGNTTAGGAVDRAIATTGGDPKPDVDEQVLELSRIARQHTARGKALDQREQVLKRQEEGLSRFAKMAQIAKSAQEDPYAALEQLAQMVGLDPDAAAEALVVKRAGGDEKKLTADERVARLEAKRAEDEAARAKADEDAKTREQEQQSQKAIDGHLGTLKSLAEKGSFPLVTEDSGTHVQDAFDLMVMFWQAQQDGAKDPKGNPIKQITHIQALNMVEKGLRERAEKYAAKLGYAKTPNESRTADIEVRDRIQDRTPQASTPRSASAAPIENRPSILSDDDIAADWERELRSMASR